MNTYIYIAVCGFIWFASYLVINYRVQKELKSQINKIQENYKEILFTFGVTLDNLPQIEDIQFAFNLESDAAKKTHLEATKLVLSTLDNLNDIHSIKDKLIVGISSAKFLYSLYLRREYLLDLKPPYISFKLIQDLKLIQRCLEQEEFSLNRPCFLYILNNELINQKL